MKDTYAVELSVLDNGVVLSVNQSRHPKYLNAFNEARRTATAYAKRYGMTMKPVAGGFFLIQDKAGRTQAQTAVR